MGKLNKACFPNVLRQVNSSRMKAEQSGTQLRRIKSKYDDYYNSIDYDENEV